MAGWNGSDTAGTANPAPSSAGGMVARRIAANMASIKGVPEDLLGGVDREWALVWARKGYDVYACRGADGEWYLWLATRCMELRAVAPGVELRAQRKSVHH